MSTERTPAGEAERAREIRARLATLHEPNTPSVAMQRTAEFLSAAETDIRWLLAECATMAARIEALEAAIQGYTQKVMTLAAQREALRADIREMAARAAISAGEAKLAPG